MVLTLLLLSCCNRNPLRTNEKDLVKDLLSGEKQKMESERQALENSEKDSLVDFPAGFRFREDRSVDPANPPVIIDFSGDVPEREVKLSDFGSRIRYIVLQVPDDSSFFSWGSFVHFTEDNIIVNNNFGIQRFDGEGKFLETICKNYVDVPRNGTSAGFFPRESAVIRRKPVSSFFSPCPMSICIQNIRLIILTGIQGISNMC